MGKFIIDDRYDDWRMEVEPSLEELEAERMREENEKFKERMDLMREQIKLLRMVR